MDTHVRILAAFHIAFGLIGLTAAFVLLIIFGGAAGAASFAAADQPEAWVAVPILSIVGSVLIMVALTLSVPGIIGGWGLLKRKSWARILMIVLSALHLINIPFGTILGIYGLWVLLSKETELLFGERVRVGDEATPQLREHP
jgi:hypothetical protein